MVHHIFLVIAPSGAGKSSLIKALLKSREQTTNISSDININKLNIENKQAQNNICLSISYTTRPMRAGEENGREYHFIDTATFEKMRQENRFAEWANVHGNYYGTSADWLNHQLQSSDVLLEIDYQGAAQIHQRFPSAVQIFILPPSFTVLKQRLVARGTDAPEVIEKRLHNAKEEIAYLPKTDYCIINLDFNQAVTQLSMIIDMQKYRSKYIDLDAMHFYN